MFFLHSKSCTCKKPVLLGDGLCPICYVSDRPAHDQVNHHHYGNEIHQLKIFSNYCKLSHTWSCLFPQKITLHLQLLTPFLIFVSHLMAIFFRSNILISPLSYPATTIRSSALYASPMLCETNNQNRSN